MEKRKILNELYDEFYKNSAWGISGRTGNVDDNKFEKKALK